MNCPQCGEETAVLWEGYCADCRDERQRELDEHNARFDEWARLSDSERDRRIKNAMRFPEY